MVGGQVLDMQSEERLCTEQEVLDIQNRKTGALIRAACMLGVLAGGGTREQLNAAAEFATHLGLAFQVRDDVLDVIGDAQTMGKAIGVDKNKNTFVHLHGLKECSRLISYHTEEAVKALSAFSNNDCMVALAHQLINRIS